MSKMVASILVLWAVLAAPVLAYWEYDGTTVYISQPQNESDPYGHWHCYWSGSGSVNGNTTSLSASGYTYGGAEVDVWAPDDHQIFQVGVYAWSTIRGESDYHWVDDQTSREISWDLSVSLGTIYVAYDGDAFNRVMTHSISASSGAVTQGGGGVTYGGYHYGYGIGSGSARAPNGGDPGSHSASNSYGSWNDVDVIEDYADSGAYLLERWYEGELILTASADASGGGTPSGIYMYSSASVSGSCTATASITIGNPNLQGGTGYADAYYFVNGSSDIQLYGNIDDRE